MKCPKRYSILQYDYRKPIINSEEQFRGENHCFVEIQEFNECYQEECGYWDKEKKQCRIVES